MIGTASSLPHTLVSQFISVSLCLFDDVVVIFELLLCNRTCANANSKPRADDGTFQPILQVLQTESGDQVARSQDVSLNATLDNEQFFGGVVRLQEVLNNIRPTTAVGAGTQVNIDQVPADIVAVLTGNDFAAKQAALESSNLTRQLLQADAVVGVEASFDNADSNVATSAGMTCAICHITTTPAGLKNSEGEFITLPIGLLY